MAIEWKDLDPDEQEYLSQAVASGGAIGIGSASTVDGSRMISFGQQSRQFSKLDAASFLDNITSLAGKGLLAKIRENENHVDYEVTQAGYDCFPSAEGQ